MRGETYRPRGCSNLAKGVSIWVKRFDMMKDIYEMGITGKEERERKSRGARMGGKWF